MELKKAYGSGDNVVMTGQYLWRTIKAHKVMDDLLRAQF